jgi:1,4-alpha-glucan branching enzyme
MTTMRSFTRVSTPALLLLLLAGCAGGWRNTPPGTEASGSATTVAAATPAGAAPAATSATAEGVPFVWKGSGNSVAVAGEFNAWNTGADPLAKQADGSWAVTRKLEPGRYLYKFVIDGNTWKEDPTAKESADDGYGGKNSVVVVGGGASASGTPRAGAAPASAPASTGGAGTGKPPAITADGVVFTFAGTATSVALAGDFNAWSPTVDPMTRQSDGTWTVVKKLPSGPHTYKFVINGTTWKVDDANPNGSDDGYGGKNSVVTVP